MINFNVLLSATPNTGIVELIRAAEGLRRFSYQDSHNEKLVTIGL